MSFYLKINILIISLAVSTFTQAKTYSKYTEESDEFGEGSIQRLMLATDEKILGSLFISCFSGESLQAQIRSDKTIFPNESRNGAMWVNATYKVDTEKKPTSQEWKMNLMKYKDAFQVKGTAKMITDMMKGNKLSLRLDKSGHVFRFDLAGTKKDLKKIMKACNN